MPLQNNPAPAQPGSVAQEPAASGPPKVPGSDHSYQARIDELYGQAKHFKRENADLRERLARLEGRSEAPAAAPAPAVSTKAPRSFEEMDDGQLDEAWNYASADDTKNPQLLNQILQEKLRRAGDRTFEKAVAESEKRIQKAAFIRDMNARILQEFGAEAFDKESPLFEAAAMEMDEYIRIHGPEKANLFRYDAFLRAFHKTKTPANRERLEQLEAENVALHQRASVLERGGVIGAAPKPSNEAMEALKTGGPREAIKRLKLTQNLIQDVQRRAVIPGR